MHAFPHRYIVSSKANPESQIDIESNGLPTIVSMPPPEFGGPGGHWSPEHLLVASVADCFILTFRAIARASKLPWQHLQCQAEGVLDRVDKITRFTRFNLQAKLTLPADTDQGKARRLLEKAEQGCLITNSMTAEVHLQTEVVFETD